MSEWKHEVSFSLQCALGQVGLAPSASCDRHEPATVFPFALSVAGSVVARDLVLHTEKSKC